MKCIAANGNTLYGTKTFTNGVTGPFWNNPSTVCAAEVDAYWQCSDRSLYEESVVSDTNPSINSAVMIAWMAGPCKEPVSYYVGPPKNGNFKVEKVTCAKCKKPVTQAVKCLAPMGITKFDAGDVYDNVNSCLYEGSQAEAVLSMCVAVQTLSLKSQAFNC